MMAIYGAGFVAVFLVFALLYGHAYRLRDRMGLTPLEAHTARANVANCLVMVACGLFSIALALLVPGPAAAPIAGFSYFLIGPVQWFVAMRMQRFAPAGVDVAGSGGGVVAQSPVEPASPLPPIHTS
jgi:hypothetical protein